MKVSIDGVATPYQIGDKVWRLLEKDSGRYEKCPTCETEVWKPGKNDHYPQYIGRVSRIHVCKTDALSNYTVLYDIQGGGGAYQGYKAPMLYPSATAAKLAADELNKAETEG